ncbi:MAG: BAX inhibitor (BI)-1/YccA family protein, partial [Pseudomonadota bacterium]
MADYQDGYLRRSGAASRPMDMSIDQGLRSYMLGVYNYMAIALAVTGLVAFGTA